MSFFDESKLSAKLTARESPKSHTVLIVDDEQDNVDILKSVLKQDYNVLTASDGAQALELINNNENSDQIHLIISDQRMPNLSGVDFLAKTLNSCPQSMRMILTAFSDVDVIIDSINKGHIYKFIIKPFDRDDLKVTVKRALEAFELSQENNRLISHLKLANEELELKVVERTKDLRIALAQQQKLNKQLEHFATIDGLTNIYNRRFYLESCKKFLALAKRQSTPSSVIMLDIDHFKRINDQYGHSVGDDVLKILSALMKEHMRENDLVGRLGGEEFSIFLTNTTIELARVVAERLRKEIEATICHQDPEVKVTISMGLSQTQHGECCIEELIKQADEALYFSKDSGRNCVNVYGC